MNPELGLYYCFGCQESGDAITFVRKLDGLDFPEAVERLAARAGITVRYDSTAVSQDRQRKERLSDAVGAAIDFYHRILLEQPEGGRARGYLRSRGFDGDAARRFVHRVVAGHVRRAEQAPPGREATSATTSSTRGSRS